MLLDGHRQQAVVQFQPSAHCLCVTPRPDMRIHRVREFVLALIGVGIGPLRRTQQGKPQDISFRVVPILAVIQEAEAVPGVRNVRPAERGHLELRLLCRRVASRGPLDGAVGDFIRRFGVVRAERKRNLQQDVLLMPAHMHFYINARNAGIHRDVLRKRGILEMLLHADHCAQRAVLKEPYFIGLVQIPMLLLEIGINVPGIPLLGLVHEGLQQISANRILGPAAVGFSWSQRLGAAALIHEARDTPGRSIELEAHEFVLQGVRSRLHSALIGDSRRAHAHKISAVAHRGRAGQQKHTCAMGGRIHRQKL